MTDRRVHAHRLAGVVGLLLVVACGPPPPPPGNDEPPPVAASGPSPDPAGDEVAPPAAPPTDRRLRPGEHLALSTGDTVIWIGAGPAEVPGEPTGLYLRYQVSFSFADTLHVERVALAVWREHVRPRLRTEPPFVALSAARPDPGGGVWNVRSYGIVLERTPDGRYASRKTGRIVD